MFVSNNKVRVKSNLKKYKKYGEQSVVEDMMNYRGKVVTISKVLTNGLYQIEEDGGSWIWTDEMFDELVTNKVGKVVNIVLTQDKIEKLCKINGKNIDTVSIGEIVSMFNDLPIWK